LGNHKKKPQLWIGFFFYVSFYQSKAMILDLQAGKFPTLTWQSGKKPAGRTESGPSIAPGAITSIHTHTGGARVVWRNLAANTTQTELVTQTPLAIATQTGLHILVTPADTSVPAFYALITTILSMQLSNVSTGTRLVMAGDNGTFGGTLNVTETIAVLNNRIEAAIAASTSSWEEVTAAGSIQSTATQTNDEFVRIVGGTANQGVKLPLAAPGLVRYIYNATATAKKVYPFLGDQIENLGVNIPFVLGSGEGLQLTSNKLGLWQQSVSEHVQDLTGVGTTQSGAAQINAESDYVVGTISAGQVAFVMPPAVVPAKITITNTHASLAARIFPSTGEYINQGAVDAESFLAAGRSVSLICTVAGRWDDAQSSFGLVSLNTIREKVTGNAVFVETAAGVAMTAFAAAAATFYVPINPRADQITAWAGGGQGSATIVQANIVDVNVVATTGDSVRLNAAVKQCFLSNTGAKSLDLFPPSGGTINGGSVDAAVAVPVGAKLYVTSINGVAFTTTYIGAQCSTQAGITAFATGGQANGTVLNTEVITIGVVASTGDSVTINLRLRKFDIANSGANDADMFPPTGGTINGGAPNAALSLVAGKRYHAFSADGLTWFADLSN